MATKIRIGTRGSALARWQANWVAARLAEHLVESELVIVTTQGDQRTRESVVNIGAPGVFTKELQSALLQGTIDVAVHSLKDLPTDEVPGLHLAAVPPRESPADVLISRDGLLFSDLPQGAKIGTGSLRRRAQLLHARPDLEMADIRGNIDTRIQKLRAAEYDAIVLAEAGLKRLDRAHEATQLFALEQMVPAAGQGALGIETRVDDASTAKAVQGLDDRTTHLAVRAERRMLAAVQAGCLAPVGAWSRMLEVGSLALTGVVLAADGTHRICITLESDATEPEELGSRVADALLAEGADRLIARSRES